MKKVIDAIRKAAGPTAEFMTKDIRQQALSRGWDANVVANMHVEHDGKNFNIKVHPSVATRAHELEYGTETVRPNSVIRKYSNNSGKASSVLFKNISKEVKGKL